MAPIYYTSPSCTTNQQLYPVADRCDQYYECKDGDITIVSCPKDLYFDCLIQTCNNNTFEVCCGNDTSISFFLKVYGYPCKDNITVGSSVRPYEFIKCIEGRVAESVCPYGEFCNASLRCYDKKTSVCDAQAGIAPYIPTVQVSGIELSSAKFETCPVDNGTYSIRKNPHLYYNCSTGKPYLYKCPEDYVYDCLNEVCSEKTWHFCSMSKASYEISGHDILYSCKNNVKIHFWYDNGYYYVCSDKVVYYVVCSPMKYSNITKTCYGPANATGNEIKGIGTKRGRPTKVHKIRKITATPMSKTIEPFSGPSTEIGNEVMIYTRAEPRRERPAVVPIEGKEMSETVEPFSGPSTETGNEVMIYTKVEPKRKGPAVVLIEGKRISETKEPCCDPSIKNCEGKNVCLVTEVFNGTCGDRFKSIAVWSNCSQFILFKNDHPEIQTCEGDLMFNGFSKCCVIESNTYTGMCAGDPRKPLLSYTACVDIGQNEEHPTECDSYFTCNQQNSIEQGTCPTGKLFDWERKTCLDTVSARTVQTCQTPVTANFVKCSKTSTWRKILCQIIMFFANFMLENAIDNCISVLCKVTSI